MSTLRDLDTPGTNSTEPQLPNKSDLVVGSIPFQDGKEFDALQQYAGQIPMKGDKDVMFFWLISNQTNTQNHDKLILWLNGGPGCTSLDGVFMENGPYKFLNSNKLGFRDHSLTQQFDVLYIDQPYGTGFSMAKFGDYAQSFKQSTRDLVDFLKRFYKVFPEYRTKQLYLAGESEAGTYIPYLADSILRMDEEERFNLGGLMIGNGWVDPYPMYMSYVEILRQNDLLSPTVQKKMLALMDKCTHEFNRAPQPVHTDVCERIPEIFLDEGGPSPGTCYNMYDLRLTDTHPSCGMNWPPEVSQYTAYLNRKDVQHALNIHPNLAPAVWKECNSTPNTMLKADTSPPSATLLPFILEHVPVLFFVGQKDFLCNYVGIEWTIGNLTWAGATGFSPDISAANWTIENSVVGHVRSDRGLTYALIDDASHMVGVDKPREILDLFTAFTNASATNLKFASSFRSLTDGKTSPPTAPTVEVPEDTSVGSGQWIGLGLLLAFILVFIVCFVRRRQLFAWWIARRKHQYQTAGTQQLDNNMLVPRRMQNSMDGIDGMDDAFVMSEFAFNKHQDIVHPVDVEGLLLDDDIASSPDEDMDSTV
ncbi:Cell death protease, partial [Coemansia sp. Benny D115]